MAKPDDPGRPKPSAPGYLPRLWKAEPEPVADLEETSPEAGKRRSQKGSPEGAGAPSPAPRKKKKKANSDRETGESGSKLEETPAFDTYQARQRARWIIGGLMTTLGLLGLILVVRAFRGGNQEIPDEDLEPRVVNDGRANAEVEARNLVENARQADKAGKTTAAVELLQKVAKNYPGTSASRVAMTAIDRHRRDRPLFGVDAPEQASGPKPPPPGQGTALAPAPVASAVPGPAGPSAPSTPELISPQVVVAQAPPPIAVKPLPTGFREKPETSIHESGWPMRIVCERDGGEMVLVPGGSFVMGREDGEPAERPSHRVSVSTYYIDLHEVTVRQFMLFLRETGRPVDAAKLISGASEGQPSIEDHPVVNVSAQQAKAYCNWARKRLPTEAQWEYAARSDDGRISYWNGELPRKDPDRGSRSVDPVMTLPSDLSPFGAFDMAANAWEWTGEYWDSQYYQQFRNPVIDPTGPRQSRSRPAQATVKGGSRSGILTWREGQKLETRLPFLGFRGALPVEGAAVAPASVPTNPSAPDSNLPGGVVPF